MMHTKQLSKNLFLIDLQAGGFKNLFASYLIKGKQIIIEAGPPSSVPNMLSALKELNVDPETVAYIALSHIHVDHGGGSGALLKSLPNAKVVVHPRGAPHLIDPEKLWQSSQAVLGDVARMFGKPEPVQENRILTASDGVEINIGNGAKLQVVETLGHASHHLSFFEPHIGGLFPGEAAGMYLSQFDIVIPTSPPPFRFDAAIASLNRLIALEPKGLYYSHFGEAADAAERLRKHAIQLKLWMSIAEEGVKKQEDQSTIRERIFAEDESIARIAGFLKSNPTYNMLVEESIQGLIDCPHKPT
jgi:glyoxylase-like metal-dependent hydrolase (beta-lactamase superfamily II)